MWGLKLLLVRRGRGRPKQWNSYLISGLFDFQYNGWYGAAAAGQNSGIRTSFLVYLISYLVLFGAGFKSARNVTQKHDLRDSGSGADRGNSNKRETAKCPLGRRREQALMPRCQMFDLNSDATYVEFKFDSAIWFNFRFRHRSG